MKRILQALLILLLGTRLAAIAQDAPTRASSRQFSEPIYFRIGQSNIDLDFEGNRGRMEDLISRLNRVLSDPGYVVSKVVVTGTASPDGNEEVNKALAGQRARQLADYLLRHTSLPESKLKVVNGGENWAGLRMMIENSRMPNKGTMLGLMERYPDDRDKRKNAMQYYGNSVPWKYMYEHFFPALRMGAGGSQGGAREHSQPDLLSLRNWERVREVIVTLPVSADVRRQMYAILDTEPDGMRRLERLNDLCSPGTYTIFQRKLFSALLNAPSVLSEDNWTLLWERLGTSKLPQRDQLLRIIENVPILEGREQQLWALDGGKPYQSMLASHFSGLLTSNRLARTEPFASATGHQTLGAANWQQLASLIEASNMQGRELALSVIRGNNDATTRSRLLRQIDNGAAYSHIGETFFPELLFGLSPAAQENWAILADEAAGSILPYKEEILDIIHNTPAGQEREESIRALDNGYSWQQLCKMLLPRLLSGTEIVTETVSNGSGVSVYYEENTSFRTYAATPARRQAAPESAARQSAGVQTDALQSYSAGHTTPAEQGTAAVQTAVTQPAAAEPKPVRMNNPFTPLLAVKTDLLLWGGVMPGFELGTWTPNLSAEFYFADRWSVQAGYAYSAWNALTGSKSLYSVSGADAGVRFWTGKPSRFSGLYVGLFGQYGEYDIQEQKTYSGNTGTFYSGGLGVGYLLPFARNWAFELEVRGGYRSSNNDAYRAEAGHYYYEQSQTLGKFAPQVRLQFIYRFGLSK